MTGERILRYDADDILRAFDPSNRLDQYFRLLAQENRRLNLVSRETMADQFSVLRRLAVESLVPLSVINRESFESYLDIGSGGGIPAIPLILTGKIKHATLVERTQKKAAALRRMLIALDLRAEIIPNSFEQITWDKGFDLVTLRLVKLTQKMLNRILPLLNPGGYFVHYAIVDLPFSEPGIERTVYKCQSTDEPGAGRFTLYHKQF
ncbi:MAG: RsmG family class I SAM-dependent methyltransferase [Candidatus Zixiibacteriota bacterium]